MTMMPIYDRCLLEVRDPAIMSDNVDNYFYTNPLRNDMFPVVSVIVKVPMAASQNHVHRQ